MTVDKIMADLKAYGDENIKKILVKHGVKEPFFGVKIEYLKPIQKKVKINYQLAKDLYATGNADAQYLAGLIADDAKMTKADLQSWAEQALSNNISDYTVPWVAAEGGQGLEMALEWIRSPQSHIQAAGWATLGNLVALKPDGELPLDTLEELMFKVADDIHTADNRIRSSMNNFIIAVGCYVLPLKDDAIAASNKMGTVMIDKNGTACKIPTVADSLAKVEARGKLGQKKKTVKC